MSTRLDLGKRPENYISFAWWCHDNKMSPRIIAECIELCSQLDRGSRLRLWSSTIDQVKERLSECGATDIEFKDDWPWFVSPIGERTTLPIRKWV